MVPQSENITCNFAVDVILQLNHFNFLSIISESVVCIVTICHFHVHSNKPKPNVPKLILDSLDLYVCLKYIHIFYLHYEISLKQINELLQFIYICLFSFIFNFHLDQSIIRKASWTKLINKGQWHTIPRKGAEHWCESLCAEESEWSLWSPRVI